VAGLGVQAPLASAEALPGRLRLVERGTETVGGFSAAMNPPQVIQNHLALLLLHLLPLTKSLLLRDHPRGQVILSPGPNLKPSHQAVQDTQNHCPAIRPLGPKIELLPVTKNPQGLLVLQLDSQVVQSSTNGQSRNREKRQLRNP
jgi:hypothetical protein